MCSRTNNQLSYRNISNHRSCKYFNQWCSNCICKYSNKWQYFNQRCGACRNYLWSTSANHGCNNYNRSKWYLHIYSDCCWNVYVYCSSLCTRSNYELSDRNFSNYGSSKYFNQWCSNCICKYSNKWQYFNQRCGACRNYLWSTSANHGCNNNSKCKWYL